jgi:hypothetical protein
MTITNEQVHTKFVGRGKSKVEHNDYKTREVEDFLWKPKNIGGKIKWMCKAKWEEKSVWERHINWFYILEWDYRWSEFIPTKWL